ncbi:ATP-binding protein [Lederbergia lenta]|uniref:ATP-binding protein n=1 Tax=Lederbergia lenta TaxID=1467 RepID=UPI002040D363|nr:ATP-binding protein [Lederbergia lenta]MCM3110696.1 ATP-binding protein [Lederbergia lenta]
MEIKLPRRFNRNTMYGFLEEVISADKKPVSNIITLDFNSLDKFIEPSGVTVLSNLIYWLINNGTRVTIKPPEDLSDQRHPGRFLDDSLFFEMHLGKTLRDNAFVRDTTLPLKHITTLGPSEWLDNTFIPWLSRTIGVIPINLATVKICMEEIFNNVSNHSDKDSGCIFAQHIPRNDEVLISISDFGVGIPYNVQEILPSLNDSESILKATERGFTTQSTPRNRGAGLDNLIHNIVLNGSGSVHIHSLSGIVNCSKGNNGINYETQTPYGYYPGTLIDMVFKTDADLFDDEEEDFSWEDW